MVGCSAAVVILCFSSRLQPGDKRAVCSSHWVPAVPCMVPHYILRLKLFWCCCGSVPLKGRPGDSSAGLPCAPSPSSWCWGRGCCSWGPLSPPLNSLSLGTCSSGLLGTLWQLGIVCAVPSPKSRCHSCLGAFAGSQQGSGTSSPGVGPTAAPQGPLGSSEDCSYWELLLQGVGWLS